MSVPRLNISRQRLVCIVISLLVAGCAGQRQIIVDQRGVDPVRYQRDLADCEAYGEQVRSGRRVAGGTATGAAVGGAAGAAAGNTTTAQRGAGVGAVLGFFRGFGSAARERDQVVRRCMIGRGYRVLN